MHDMMMRAPLVNFPYGSSSVAAGNNGDQMEVISNDPELRRGPWTLEEDTLLSHYIARHGEGRWNMLAKFAGLKRTGKSCRLRWLNYLKPDIKRGNLTPKEQLLILELHSKWGNRWSRIAQHLPGRTDNEIKNYWRTRVQRQARQLNIESNSKRFLDAVRCYWMPRLLQKVEQQTTSPSSDHDPSSTVPDDHQVAAADSGSLLSAAPDHHHQLISTTTNYNPHSFPVQPRGGGGGGGGEEEAETHHFSNSASVNSLTDSTTTVSYQYQQQQQQNPEEKILGSESIGFSMENCHSWNMILQGDGSSYHHYEEMVMDPLMMMAASGSQSAAELCQVGHDDDSSWVGYSYDVADTLWNLDDTWQYRGIGEMGI